MRENILTAGTSLLPRHIPVFMYHRVAAEIPVPSSQFVVSQRIFRKQMEYLTIHNYSTPRLSDLLSGSIGESLRGRRPVLLTFDDGYLEIVETALPVLKEFGFTCCVFLITNWLHRMNTWDTDSSTGGAQLLEPHQLLDLEKAGFECGSHTVRHRSLPALNDDDLMRELESSREMMEAIVRHPVTFLAYPYGDVNPRVKEAVRRAGYTCAFAVHTGPWGLRSDIFEIRRQCIIDRADDAYMFTALSGIARSYHWGKWATKRMAGLHDRYHDE